MGRGGRRSGGPGHFLLLRLTGEQRRDLICFCVPFVLYAVNQAVKYRVGVPVLGDVLRYHWNDYLGGIAFAAYLNLVFSFSRWPRLRLRTPLHFLIAGTLCGLFWECLTPLFLPSSTGDWRDVVAYVLGMLTYGLLRGHLTGRPPECSA